MHGGRVRVRSRAGDVLTPAEEHAEITDYFAALFSLHPHEIEPEPRLEPLILDISEIRASLGKLGKGKAVPLNHAPSSVWHYCRLSLCDPLTEAFHSETTAGYGYLSRCSDCNLALIPKPGKTSAGISEAPGISRRSW